MARGSHGKYEYWITKDGLTLLEGWARDGLTDEQIAKNIGINPATLYDWKKKYSDISKSLKKGKEVVDPRSHLVVKPPNLQEGLASQVMYSDVVVAQIQITL